MLQGTGNASSLQRRLPPEPPDGSPALEIIDKKLPDYPDLSSMQRLRPSENETRYSIEVGCHIYSTENDETKAWHVEWKVKTEMQKKHRNESVSSVK